MSATANYIEGKAFTVNRLDSIAPRALSILGAVGSAALAAVVFGGCQQSNDQDQVSQSEAAPADQSEGVTGADEPAESPHPQEAAVNPTAAAVDPTAAAEPIDGKEKVSVVGPDGYNKALESHFGQVVLVDMWALW